MVFNYISFKFYPRKELVIAKNTYKLLKIGNPLPKKSLYKDNIKLNKADNKILY